MRLYPLKFKPILKERIWGGNKLLKELEKPDMGPNIGESWEVSAVPGDVSIVSNGIYAGDTLEELLNRFPEEILGAEVLYRFGKEFPILIKFIDAAEDLSIQVHPNDALAKRRHNSFGKTEMWYVMHADLDSRLLLDFKRPVSQEEYQQYLAEGRLLELMNHQKVAQGDTFFINAGKVHAIGAGIMLAEIQQTSNLTYRLYDYDRRDAEGNARQLHTEQALEAIDYSAKEDYRVVYGQKENTMNLMVDSPYFKTNFLPLSGRLQHDLSERESFTICIVVDGTVRLEADGEAIHLSKGETCLIPAAVKSLLLESENARLLEVSL